MNMLDKTLDGVSAAPHIKPAVALLVHNIGAQVRLLAGNPEAAAGYADMLDREADNISSHVLANTPMITATPEFHPEPPRADDKGAFNAEFTGKPEELAIWFEEHPDVKEFDRKQNADGTITVYFEPFEPAPVAKIV